MAVLFFEDLQDPLRVVGLLAKRFRVPRASVGTEEIATIDVERAGVSADRIGHGVDDLGPE